MFRGFTRREVHFAMACVVLIGTGVIVGSAKSGQQYQFKYSGRAIEHQPGELAVAQNSLKPDESAEVVTSDAALVDLNSASVESIESLPGVGPGKAKAIIQWREQNGSFQTIEDIDKVPGIGPGILDQLREFVVVKELEPVATEVALAPTPQPSPSAIPAATPQAAPTVPPPSPEALASAIININSATLEEIDTLDGIGPQLASRILQDRAANGPFRSVDDLQRVKGIGPKLVERNRHRLAVR